MSGLVGGAALRMYFQLLTNIHGGQAGYNVIKKNPDEYRHPFVITSSSTFNLLRESTQIEEIMPTSLVVAQSPYAPVACETATTGRPVNATFWLAERNK